MYIKKLKIINFRKIENIDIELNKNINVFIGKNAQGKTSILNADELIKKNFLFGKIRGNIRLDGLVKIWKLF